MPFDPARLAFLGGVLGSQRPSPIPVGFGQAFGQALLGGLGAQQQAQAAERDSQMGALRQMLMLKELSAKEADELQLVGDPSSGLGIFNKSRGTYQDIKPGNAPAKTRTVKRGGMEITEEYDSKTMKWNPIGESPIWDPERNAITPYQQAQLGLSQAEAARAQKRLAWEMSQPRDEPLVEVHDPNSPTGTSYRRRSEAAGMPGEAKSGTTVYDREGNPIVQMGGTQAPMTADQRNKLSVARMAHAKLNTIIPRLDSMVNALGGASVWPDAERAQMQTAYTNMLMEAKNIYELGAITGPDQKILGALVGDPASWQQAIVPGSEGRIRAQLRELQRIVDDNLTAAEAAYGGTYRPPARQSNAASPGQQPAPSTTVAPPNQLMERPPLGQVAPPQPAPQNKAPVTLPGANSTVDGWLR